MAYTPATPLRGVLKDFNGEPVVGANVTVDQLPGRLVATTSDGGFNFSKVPGKAGDRVRGYVKKPGFNAHNEYVALPGFYQGGTGDHCYKQNFIEKTMHWLPDISMKQHSMTKSR